MTFNLADVFWLAAILCFAFAAAGVTARVHLGWVGLALFTLPFLLR